MLLPRQISGQSKQTLSGNLILLDGSSGINHNVILIKPWTVGKTDNQGNSVSIEPLRFTITDSNGNYTFENVPPGTYYIAAEQDPVQTSNANTLVYVYTTPRKVTQIGVFSDEGQQSGMVVAVIVPTLENDYPIAFNGTPRLLLSGPGLNQSVGQRGVLECEMMDYPEIEGTNWQMYRNGGYKVIKQVIINNPGSGYTYSPQNPGLYEPNGTYVSFSDGAVKKITIDNDGTIHETSIPSWPPFGTVVIAKNAGQYVEYIQQMETTGTIEVPDEAFYIRNN